MVKTLQNLPPEQQPHADLAHKMAKMANAAYDRIGEVPELVEEVQDVVNSQEKDGTDSTPLKAVVEHIMFEVELQPDLFKGYSKAAGHVLDMVFDQEERTITPEELKEQLLQPVRRIVEARPPVPEAAQVLGEQLGLELAEKFGLKPESFKTIMVFAVSQVGEWRYDEIAQYKPYVVYEGAEGLRAKDVPGLKLKVFSKPRDFYESPSELFTVNVDGQSYNAREGLNEDVYRSVRHDTTLELGEAPLDNTYIFGGRTRGSYRYGSHTNVFNIVEGKVKKHYPGIDEKLVGDYRFRPAICLAPENR